MSGTTKLLKGEEVGTGVSHPVSDPTSHAFSRPMSRRPSKCHVVVYRGNEVTRFKGPKTPS